MEILEITLSTGDNIGFIDGKPVPIRANKKVGCFSIGSLDSLDEIQANGAGRSLSILVTDIAESKGFVGARISENEPKNSTREYNLIQGIVVGSESENLPVLMPISIPIPKSDSRFLLKTIAGYTAMRYYNKKLPPKALTISFEKEPKVTKGGNKVFYPKFTMSPVAKEVVELASEIDKRMNEIPKPKAWELYEPSLREDEMGDLVVYGLFPPGDIRLLGEAIDVESASVAPEVEPSSPQPEAKTEETEDIPF